MITQAMLDGLEQSVGTRISGRRFSHTKGVAVSARLLAEFCGVDPIIAEAAGLLHDVSKELSDKEQIHLIDEEGIILDEDDLSSPQIWHSYTAPIIIKRDFQDFATPEILSATRKHTVGNSDMSTLDCIIFLADFIEDTRVYDASNELRKYVFENMRTGETEENIRILKVACIKMIDFTIEHLLSTGKKVNHKTLLTKNALLSKI